MIADLNLLSLIELVYKALKDRKTKVRKWKPILDLYEALEKTIVYSKMQIDIIEHFANNEERKDFIDKEIALTESSKRRLQESGIDPKSLELIWGNEEAKWIQKFNSKFEDLDKMVLRLIEGFGELHRSIEIHDEDLIQRFRFHLAFKSSWLRIFQENYTAGKITSEGKKLRRVTAKFQDKTEEFNTESHFSFYSRDKEKLKEIILVEELDISDPKQRAQFTLMGKQNVECLETIYQKLRELIKTNCTIDDLL